tara:strand:- start:265 stop:828 length:564 start_codon:yes stop_codon:yes gene_type:complete
MEIKLNDTMKLPSGKDRSIFDTAIPGQSLTKTPNIYPWDKPPMMNTPDEAMNYFIDKFDNDANAEKLLSLIDSQIPVSVIADSLLLAGFAEGVFNPDVAILTAEDLTMLLMKIAEDANIEYKIIPNQDSVIDEGLEKIAEFKKDKTDFQKATTQSPSERLAEETPEEEIQEQPMEQPQGLMARQEIV